VRVGVGELAFPPSYGEIPAERLAIVKIAPTTDVSR
jgi:hypothetical protein